MKLSLPFLFVVSLVPAANPDDAKNPKDQAKLAGTWQAVSIIVNGNSMPEGHVKNVRLVLTDGKFIQQYAGRAVRQGALRVDEAKQLKLIDFSYRGDDGKEETYEGIYALEGDRLTICDGRPGVVRPLEFVSKPDTGHILTVYQREKP
jgi:uncharacterized protein (TIGR03067 family)